MPGELDRLVQGLREGLRRFATGTFVLWYPIKRLPDVAPFREEVARVGIEKLLSVELMVRDGDGIGLAGCGLLIANPPYTLHATLNQLLPFLTARLAHGPGASGTATSLSAAPNDPPAQRLR